MTTNEAPAKMATHFHKKNRISAGRVIVASPTVQDESVQSVAGVDNSGPVGDRSYNALSD